MEKTSGSGSVNIEMADNEKEICLVQTRRHKIPLKHFDDEVRSSLDIEHFLINSNVVLDIQETSLSDVVKKMLEGDEELSALDFGLIAPFIFTSEIPPGELEGVSIEEFKDVIQSATDDEQGLNYQKRWLAVQATVPFVFTPKIFIGRLSKTETEEDKLRIIILIFSPPKSKLTKTCTETSRSISTFFSDDGFSERLLTADTPTTFQQMINERKEILEKIKEKTDKIKIELEELPGVENIPLYHLGRGLFGDIKRRLPHYVSDFIDVFKDGKSISKVISTTIFLYFACLLPSIAFGSLNDGTTSGKITVQKTIIAQAAGGLFFALFSGQPLVILLTTAPLALYISIIQDLADRYNYDFLPFYAAVGIINAAFLIIYVLINLSKLMKFSTRSIEEIFGFFITLAFCKDALKHLSSTFDHYYYDYHLFNATVSESVSLASVFDGNALNSQNDPASFPDWISSCATANFTDSQMISDCVLKNTLLQYATRDKALLAMILTLGTAWLGLQIHTFRKSPFLASAVRELIADYALAISVIVFSLIGSIGFKAIKLESFSYTDISIKFTSGITDLPADAWGWATLLGFCLSLLFFMDQNISAAMVNTPGNKLQKGAAYHLDLLVVAIINIPLSLLGLPWIHGALPHSPLHARALADTHESVEDGHVKETILFVRETRTTAVLAHILIGISLLAIPTPLTSIPKPVLDGLFLFLGLSGLYGNQFFERIMLLVSEQDAYPPNHYIRRVPQKKIHIFTICQCVQLIVLAVIGFFPWPYLKMIFPVIILLLMPVRHKLLPLIVEERYIHAMECA